MGRRFVAAVSNHGQAGQAHSLHGYARAQHSYLSDLVYPTLLEALLRWVQHGDMPTPSGIAQRCNELEATFGAGCRFVADYRPAPLSSRVAPR